MKNYFYEEKNGKIIIMVDLFAIDVVLIHGHLAEFASTVLPEFFTPIDQLFSVIVQTFSVTAKFPDSCPNR